MKQRFTFALSIQLFIGVLLIGASLSPFPSLALPLHASTIRFLQQATLTPTPVFRYPVVPNATISAFPDHVQTPTSSGEDFTLHFYNGNVSSGGYGFYFYCANSGVDDYSWVGCSIPNNGQEENCPDNKEMWYDNHKGIDFEYATDWHTGATCDRFRWGVLNRSIYAPAAGKVRFIGNTAANGNYFKIAHDLNGNGNYDDDKIRSVYLHFDNGGIGISLNQIVNDGQFLGLGGQTGATAVTPHLHFEVQRSSDSANFSNPWTVDPYGWQGSGSDPWGYANYKLWQPNLSEGLWRGGQSWSRTIPVTNNVIQWGSATSWAGPGPRSNLPGGTSEIQATNSYVLGNTLYQTFWTSNSSYLRTVPIVNGVIEWTSATSWLGPNSLSSLPGTGDFQALNGAVIANKFQQAYWRGDQGWSRTLDIVNGVITGWNSVSWSGPSSLSNLPGSGSVQAINNFVIGDKFWQTYWKNNVRRIRSVSFDSNGGILWNTASAWVIDMPTLSGSGNITAQGGWIFP